MGAGQVNKRDATHEPRSLKRLALSLASLVAFALVSVPANAGLDPALEWRMFETPHFTVIYDAKQSELARAYGRWAEQAWAANTTVFREWPAKTVLVINDATDVANGFAVGIPYPMIQVFPVLPGGLDSIDDYGDWGHDLMTHEYAHVLNFEPSNGAFKALRWAFGSIARPNMLLPKWYMEGLAVYQESRFSRHGRLRSPSVMAVPRAMARDDMLANEDISRAGETGIPDWPGGQRPYLIGGLMWAEMAREKGDSILETLNQDYSRRFPYFISGPARSRLGVDYQEILWKTYDRVRTQSEKQLATIRAAGTTPTQPLLHDGIFAQGAVISPDGTKLAFALKSHNRDSRIEIVERPKGSKQPFTDFRPRTLDDSARGLQRVSWLPDSSGLVYESLSRVGRFKEYFDLYKIDLASGKIDRLTNGLRAKEPTVAPDGRAIAFVQADGGSTRLAQVDADGKNPRVLYAPSIGVRISRPAYLSPSRIAFAEKGTKGEQRIRLIKLPEATLEELSGCDARGTQPSAVNDHELVFVSDRTGVPNVYYAKRGDQGRWICRSATNVETRAIAPGVDSITGDLYFSQLDSTGAKMVRTPKQSWLNPSGAKTPAVPPMVDYAWPDYEPPAVEAAPVDDREYSSLRWMYPRYWAPIAYYLPGFFYAQAGTSAADPLGRHSYALTAAYDSLTAKPAWFASYENATTNVPMNFSFADYSEYIFATALDRRQTIAQATGRFSIPGIRQWQFGLGWNYSQTEISSVIVRDGPIAQVSYSSVQQRGLEISPESGTSLSLTQIRYLPLRDNREYELTEVRASAFFSKGLLPERHALAAFFNAQVAPRMGSDFLGRTTVGGNFQTPAAQSAYMVRGYPWGEFFGRNIFSGTLEYRFPLGYPYRGLGTSPFFVQRWHAAAFVDGVTLDGRYYDFNTLRYTGTRLGTFYLGAGAEVRGDVTVFYHVPLTMIFGWYFGLSERARAYAFTPFIGFAL